MKHLLKVFAIVILLSATNLYADVIYVKQGASGTGASWTDAFGTLQQALTASTSGDEIWVAEGTYYPTTQVGGSGERFRTFQMKDGVTIYGGFPSSGDPDMDDRDWTTYETILSGDIGTTDDNSDNCYHVFYHPDGLGLNDTAVLDGFTIRDGNADGTNENRNGGGMYNLENSPAIINCLFSHNTAFHDGAGMYNESNSPNILNCTFSNNSGIHSTYSVGGGMFNYNINNTFIINCTFNNNSAANGGAMYNLDDDNSTIINCTFSNNTAFHNSGGAIFLNNSSNSIIINSTFSNNFASFGAGGGLYNESNSLTIINSTLSYNFAYYGGGLSNEDGSTTINNSIIWGNTAEEQGHQLLIFNETTLNYSCYSNESSDVENYGTFTATNENINDDPLFVGSGDHPYSLQPASPCINTGSNGLIPDGVTTDIIGNPRISFGTVDMGAYESEFYTLAVSISPNEISDICYNSPVNLVAEIDDVEILGGAVAPLTYSWSPSFLVEHTDPSSPVATLTRAIRDGVYTLTVTDANGMQGTATVSVEVLAGNVITVPGTIVHSFVAEEITAPLNLFALALGDGYATTYSGYTLEFECRLGWLPPGETDCTGFNATAYIPLPNSRLYGWIIIKNSEGCEADRRRINVIVRGNQLGYIPD